MWREGWIDAQASASIWSCSHPAAKEVFVACVCKCLHAAWPRSLNPYHCLPYGTRVIFPTSEKHQSTKPQSVVNTQSLDFRVCAVLGLGILVPAARHHKVGVIRS